MNLYDCELDKFEQNILQCDNDIIVSDYENKDELNKLKELIIAYKKNQNCNLLECLHSLIESEVIFDKIWSVDRNVMLHNINNFELNSVYGSSFLFEMIKNVKNSRYDIFDMLYKTMAIKFFKTKEKASEYFESFINMAKDIKYLDLDKTKEQMNSFLSLFDNKHII
jgi:hypothetical protein